MCQQAWCASLSPAILDTTLPDDHSTTGLSGTSQPELLQTMEWAPVVHVAPHSGKQLGSLAIVNASTVEWMRFGTVYRRFSMQSPITTALFTRFIHAKDPGEYWIVIVCKDRLIYSYSTMSGEHYVTGLSFTPATVLACAEQGVLFTSHSHTEPVQSLHLLQGPEELLGLVVPSSVCAPLSKNDRVMFFSDHYAIVWNSEKSLVRAYSVRFIQHRNIHRPGSTQTQGSADSAAGSAGSAFSSSFSASSLSIESLSKVAVIHLVREWSQTAIGSVFSQYLDLPTGKVRIAASHDPEHDALYVLCDGELIRHSEVTHVSPIAGILGFPGVAISFREKLQFAFLMFPQTPPLAIPLPKQYSGLVISHLASEPLSNWCDINFESGQTCRLQLATNFTPVVKSCMNLVLAVAGPLECAFWLLTLLAQRTHSSDDWIALRSTMDTLTPDMDPSHVSHLVTCFHLLREEYSLTAGNDATVRALEGLIQRYVCTWGSLWTDLYGVAPSELSLDVPRTMDSPPNVYTAFVSCMQTQGAHHEYPEIASQSSLYPKTSALLEFFRRLSVETPVADMQRFLQDHFAGPRLLELAPAIKICVLEVAEYLDLDLCAHPRQCDSSGLTKGFVGLKQKHRVSKLNPSLSAFSDDGQLVAQALFPADRRFNEAERLLQTKGPQQCAFGAFFDPEVIGDHEIAHLQNEWGRALSERALASAFGRAALKLGTRESVIWEQLEVPAIDFSGECTYSGLSIPPFYKTIDQVSSEAPWGALAHGIALGLSIRPHSPGVDSLWVITSARLKSVSSEVYAGLVFGMGLSGHLAELEEWQFYKSLVNPNFRGKIAALLGVAASRRGSRDSKLTKVFSVHIRALLPEPGRSEPLVGPEEERAAIISLGLLYQGQGIRHLTEVFSRELLSTRTLPTGALAPLQTASSEINETDDTIASEPLNNDENYSLAVGLTLGLINSGKANLSHLLPLVVRARDRTSFAPGIANGALCALLLSYVGSNAKVVASQIQIPSSRRSSIYSMPSAVFAKALTHHLIMWNEIGSSSEWVLAQIPPALKAEGEVVSDIEGLWYMHALCGVLTALALRYTATNDEHIIGIVLDFVESVFYPKYSSLLKSLTVVGYENEKRLSYDKVQAAKNIAQLISTLCLAVAAIAAGSGNVRVLQVLRVAYQVNPQVQASERPSEELVEGVGIDLHSIAEAIGWLFMGSGQYSFRNDPESVGLLASVSFLPLLGGPGINAESWYHTRFLWVLVSERRCIYAAENPTEQVQVEIMLKSGRNIATKMPTLLPPLSDVQEIRVVGDMYRPLIIYDIESAVNNGISVVRQSGPQDTLEAKFSENEDVLDTFGLSPASSGPNVAARTAMQLMLHSVKHIETPSNAEALRLLLEFSENWPAPESSRIVKARDYELLKLMVWKKANNAV